MSTQKHSRKLEPIREVKNGGYDMWVALVRGTDGRPAVEVRSASGSVAFRHFEAAKFVAARLVELAPLLDQQEPKSVYSQFGGCVWFRESVYVDLCGSRGGLGGARAAVRIQTSAGVVHVLAPDACRAVAAAVLDAGEVLWTRYEPIRIRVDSGHAHAMSA